MLRDVLQAVETAEGPITLSELSRRLNIDRGVLDAMLDHWSRKGKLFIDTSSETACAGSEARPNGCSCGSGASSESCPFMARMPRSYKVNLSAVVE